MGEKEAMKVHEYHNHELVSKLVSANPPYLYSSPAAPHNFFFSEMLRSFVQKRKSDEMNPIKLKPIIKKPRKSSVYPQQLPQQKPLDLESEWKKARIESKEKSPSMVERPIEPTDHFDLTKSFQNENDDPGKNVIVDEDDSTINVDKDDADDLPPPAIPSNVAPWYHQPPFYVDPLHFFIDLRVSGHIYDRKKDYLHQALKSNALTDAGTWNGLNRPGSAFKIPNSLKESRSYSALNLITNPVNSMNVSNQASPEPESLPSNLPDRSIPKHFNYYDKNNPNNTTYVMQNLPEIYKKVYNKADDFPESQEAIDKSSDEDVEVIFDLDVKLEKKKQ